MGEGRKKKRKRERVLSFGRIYMGVGGGGGIYIYGMNPTLEEEEGFQFQISQRMNGENRSTRGKNPLVGCRENILILMRVTLQSTLRKKEKRRRKKPERERERERDAHTLLHNHARAYTHSCSHNK